MVVMDALRRFAIPGITTLAAIALEISGVVNITIATILGSICALWTLIALVTWQPVKSRLWGNSKKEQARGRSKTPNLDTTSKLFLEYYAELEQMVELAIRTSLNQYESYFRDDILYQKLREGEELDIQALQSALMGYSTNPVLDKLKSENPRWQSLKAKLLKTHHAGLRREVVDSMNKLDFCCQVILVLDYRIHHGDSLSIRLRDQNWLREIRTIMSQEPTLILKYVATLKRKRRFPWI